MNETLKKKAASAKNFVKRNQTKILVTATVVTTTAAVIQQMGLKQHNDFLKEHDLYEEFYAMTDEEN